MTGHSALLQESRLSKRGALHIRDWKHCWGSRTLIMGIVNLTPDSFSQDGLMDARSALAFADRQLAGAADILDLGAESTRPGYTPVSEAEELRRIIPVVSELRLRHRQTIISVDTSKAEVLRQAAGHGADLLNSVVGLTDELSDVVGEYRLPLVIMHNKEKPEYENGVVDEIIRYFEEQAGRASSLGIPSEKIILDPGIGFGKTAEHNIEILSQFERIAALGFPTLIGCSRKSFIGKLTGKPVSEREFGTAAALTLAIEKGVDIVRVHDVVAMKDVAAVADAVVRGKRC